MIWAVCLSILAGFPIFQKSSYYSEDAFYEFPIYGTAGRGNGKYATTNYDVYIPEIEKVYKVDPAEYYALVAVNCKNVKVTTDYEVTQYAYWLGSRTDRVDTHVTCMGIKDN